jgi:hypothetical protein
VAVVVKEEPPAPTQEPVNEPGPEKPIEAPVSKPEDTVAANQPREFNWEEKVIQLEKRGNRLLQYNVDKVVVVELGKFNNQGFYRVSIPPIDPADRQFFNIILRQIQIEAVSAKTPLPSLIKKVIAENSLVVRNAPVLAYHIMARLSPWGKLYPLIADDHVQEILCRDKAVSTIIRDYLSLGWFESTMEIDNADQAVIARRFLATTKGQEVITEEGHYGSFSISPNPNEPSMIYVKKSNTRMFPVTVLINRGVMSSLMAAYIWMATSFGGLIAVVGPPKSAKTTVINATVPLLPFNRTLSIIEKSLEHQYSNRKYSKYTPLTKGTAFDGLFLMAPDAIVVDPLEKNVVDIEKLVAYTRTGRLAFVGVEAPDVEVAVETLKGYGFPETTITSVISTGLVENLWKVLGVYEAPFKSPILRPPGLRESPQDTASAITANSQMLKRLANKKGWDSSTLEKAFDARLKFLNGLVVTQAFSTEEFSRNLMIARHLTY